MKKWFCLFIALSILLAGCSAGGTASSAPVKEEAPPASSQQQQQPEQPEEQAPIPLTLMSMYYVAESPDREDINARIAEVTGYQPEITWVPSSGYDDKVSTMMASDTLPMITIIGNPKANAFVEACRAGAFWEVGGYLQDYPHIAKANPTVFDSTRIDGKIYGIFRERPLSRQGLIYRKDWLEELGLPVPETYGQVIETIRAFSQKGKFGLADSAGNGAVPAGLEYMAIWGGAPNGWGRDENGTFIPSFMHAAYREAMDLFRDFYADGILNRNFVELSDNDANKLINSQEAGLKFGFTDDLQNRFTDLETVNPQAELSYILGAEGPDGVKRGIATTGFSGIMAFSKSAVKTEEDLRHCLDFIDKTGLPEYIDLFAWGIEGVDYEMKDGMPDRTQEPFATRYSSSAGQYGLIRCFGDIGSLQGNIPPVMQQIYEERPLWEDFLVFDASTAYLSDTQILLGADLKQQINDAVNQYVSGAIDEAGWEKAKQDWLKAGGQKVIDEYTAAAA